MTPGILPYALRARLRRFKIAPGDFVSLHAGVEARADERQKLERCSGDIAAANMARASGAGRVSRSG